MTPTRALIVLPVLTALAALTACGPNFISPERAYEECTERARAATRPTGNARVGVSSEGPFAGISIGVSSDFIQGRNPELVYDNCFRQRTGAGPTRPLVL